MFGIEQKRGDMPCKNQRSWQCVYFSNNNTKRHTTINHTNLIQLSSNFEYAFLDKEHILPISTLYKAQFHLGYRISTLSDLIST